MKRKTKTLIDRVPLRPNPDEPVIMLWMPSKNRTIELAELFGTRRRIAVGAHRRANFRIEDDPYVSSDHCHFHYEKGCLFVSCSGAKNRTFVNCVPPKPNAGYIEILPGSLLTLGKTHFLACGKAGLAQEFHLVPKVDTLVHNSDALFSPGSLAADAIGVKRRTFARWLKEGKKK